MKPFEHPAQRLSRRQFLEVGSKGGLGLLGVAIAADLFACNSTTPAATSGGTGRMLTSYPDPFTAADAPCVVYPDMTEDPCYAATLMRQDVSEGYTGLPVRLSLKVINAATCEPVPNATVDIWHTNAAGIYSAMAAGTFCNPSKEDLSATHFGRGVQPTDDILATHVDYKARSKRDTTNSNDTVMPRTNQANYILSTARMTDGVLQAWKTIALKV